MNPSYVVFDRDMLLAGVSLLVSGVLLWTYLRAVRRSMLRGSGTANADAASIDSHTSVSAPPAVRLSLTDAQSPTRRDVRSVWRGPFRAAAVQAIAGLTYAVGVTLAWSWLVSRTTGWSGFAWQGFAVFTVFFAWPLVIVIGLVATLTWRGMALLVLGYVAVLAPAALIQMQGTQVTPALFVFNWWVINGPATIFVLAVLARPIRAMGPIVGALVVASSAGVFGLANVLDASLIERVSAVATAIGFHGVAGGYAVGVLIYGTAALVAALLAYGVLYGLGRLYRAHWFSDQSLQIDAVWLTFAVLQAPKDMPYAGLLSFLFYKATVGLGQALIRPDAGADQASPRLLLLRVFSLGARSGDLFSGFSKLWRYLGSVRMIAGPDLANSTVEPHEFLDFLAGRLQRRFIGSPAALDLRLTETSQRRDPDGRFRVATFFCHADTWQMVLQRLARESDVVLMDLRGFAPANQGCVFELRALLTLVPLANILLVVDPTTDHMFLQQVLEKAWDELEIHAPNRVDPAPRVRLFPLPGPSSAGAARLVAALRPTTARAGGVLP